MSGGGSSSRGRGKGVRIVWEGYLGPDSFKKPIEQFSLESKSDFTRERPLRSYDNRTEDWPKCHHGEDCVVQMYNDCDGGGRRFFRCPRGFVFPFNSHFFQIYIWFVEVLISRCVFRIQTAQITVGSLDRSILLLSIPINNTSYIYRDASLI
jgi:hypothetical protein